MAANQSDIGRTLKVPNQILALLHSFTFLSLIPSMEPQSVGGYRLKQGIEWTIILNRIEGEKQQNKKERIEIEYGTFSFTLTTLKHPALAFLKARLSCRVVSDN